MLEKYYISKKDNTDLNLYRCGFEECAPGHAWGPGVRDHYIVHLILSGKGSFSTNGETMLLSEGQGFLVAPGQIVRYEADSLHPWTYTWAGFHGLKAEAFLKKAGLSSHCPVFSYGGDEQLRTALGDLVLAAKDPNSSELTLTGRLYLFLANLIKNQRQSGTAALPGYTSDRYVMKAIEYIEKNYSAALSVSELAKSLKIDRSYLSALFTRHLKVSPQEFIIQYRMDKAAELLKNPLLSIGDVARSVGYEDPLQFSKTFRKTKGESPRRYRLKLN
ncbi:MAG: AraC family transcriptional regulator [Clostridia bacterium]|nr:AraC family transcriptional regulator [Clostridia bacterium]